MRATTAFKRLLGLDGVHVAAVEFMPAMVVVIVVAARRELVCPECGLSTKAGYEVDRPVVSRWRHLDLGSSEVGGPRPAPTPKTRTGDKADRPGARRHPAVPR